MPIKVSISDIKSAITKAQGKVDEATTSDTNKRILDSQIRAANDRVKSSEASVTSATMTKQQAEDKLSPPPTKQIASDGKKGGSKTVVDEAEKDKLIAQVRAADVQIKQAQQTVADAKSQAESLTAESLDQAGISSDQQNSMSNLSDLMAQLKSAANDPQTNLEGDAFQDKLKIVVDKIGVLEESLPNVANTQLADFWKEMTSGMTEVQNKFVAATTPPPYAIVAGDKSSNYPEFFGDYNDGMNTLIDRLSSPGEYGSAPLIDATAKSFLQDAQLSVMRNAPSSPDAKFLGAFNAADEEKMKAVMDQVNTLINNINRDRPITGDDITKLINDSTALGTRLGSGGGDFASLLSVEFNTMGTHAESISNKLKFAGQTDTLEDFSKVTNRIALIANPNNFIGLTNKDHNSLVALGERLRVMDQTLSSGGSVTDAALTTLIDDSNTLVDTLSDHYGLDSSTSSSANNSSGIGSGVGSGSNQFASSRVR